MKFDVVSIVRALDLGEYHEAYQGKAIYVWVSAPAAFLQKRDELLIQYSRRFQKLQQLQLRAMRGAGQRFQLTKVLPRKHSGRKDAGELVISSWNTWLREEFLPAVHAWFAELLSQGTDPATHWTAAELDEIYRLDTALLEWIKRRSLELVTRYAAETRERSVAPSTAPTGDRLEKEE